MKQHFFDLAVILLRIGVVFALCMGLVMVFVWAERKGAAYIQDRRGPNRAPILGFRAWGMFHPVADAIKYINDNKG